MIFLKNATFGNEVFGMIFTDKFGIKINVIILDKRRWRKENAKQMLALR
mgnify:CR=1